MSVIQPCSDDKDILDFFKPAFLSLKPVSRLNVSVQLPQLKKSGAKISNWEVMEKVKEMAKPFLFPVFKVAKSSLEFIRFEAEIDNFGSLDQVLRQLDMKTVKLSGFQESLKVRAAEAKPSFPTRQEWDSFFRESRTMNEMKAGERPDTLHVKNLPAKWFLDPHDKSGISRDKPSEHVLRRVFVTFGDVRNVDIPSLDPYRDKMKKSISGIQTFSFGQDLVFDAFIQYKDYIGFVKAMNSLKGMKLHYKDRYDERSWVANIKVDFDKTKHLAESTIKKRAQEREKLIEKEREKEDAERRKKELEELKRASELRRKEEEERQSHRKLERENKIKLQRRMEREERRRKIKLSGRKNEDEMIAEEERKLLLAQRKLESIRLLDELLDRVKTVKIRSDNVKSLENDLLRTARAAKERASSGRKPAPDPPKRPRVTTYKDRDEKRLRDKLVSRLKRKEEDKMEEQRIKLLKCRDGFTDVSDTDMDELDKGRPTKKSESVRNKLYSDEEADDDEEELRLTSSDEEDDKNDDSKKKKKKDKKEKKRRKKEKKKKKKRDEDDEIAKRRKRRELNSHISLAQKIADKEKRSRSRERSRERTRNRRPDESSNARHEGYPDYRAIERMRERQDRRLAQKKRLRNEEKAKEEMYDKMMNPHLYGSAHFPAVPVTGHRKLRKGEHYEEVQKEFLEKEIKIRERREEMKKMNKMREQQRQYYQDRDYKRQRRPYGAARGHPNYGYRPHHDDRDNGHYHPQQHRGPPPRRDEYHDNRTRY